MELALFLAYQKITITSKLDHFKNKKAAVLNGYIFVCCSGIIRPEISDYNYAADSIISDLIKRWAMYIFFGKIEIKNLILIAAVMLQNLVYL